MASPLLLVPVELVRTSPRQLPVLEVGEEDPVLNPALHLRMQQSGITLPVVDDLEEVSLADLFGRVQAAVTDSARVQPKPIPELAPTGLSGLLLTPVCAHRSAKAQPASSPFPQTPCSRSCCVDLGTIRTVAAEVEPYIRGRQHRGL
jgi:Protein of unknown function (DUF4011)